MASIRSVKADPDESCTFKPNIGSVSRNIADGHELYQGSFKNFEQRQQEYMVRQQEKKVELRNKYAEEENYKFKPEINLNSEVICATDPSRRDGSQRAQSMQRKEQKKEHVERELYQECTFKPQINPISDKIAPSLSCAERYLNYEGQSKKQALI